MKVPYLLTTSNVTFVANGQTYLVSRQAPQFDSILDELANPQHTAESLIQLADASRKVAQEIETAIAASGEQNVPYLAKGVVKVSREGVTFNGDFIHSVLADRMVEILERGLPLAPWVKFAENLFMNPAEHAREELYLWLESSDLPITEDGHFLAYKVVTSSFKDKHTRTFDNRPGQIVELASRDEVDPVRDRTCSRGLHFCSKSYVGQFISGDDKVVLVKVNPADVVSIPSDYGNAKGRTWRYEVVDEVSLDEVRTATWEPVIGYGTTEEPTPAPAPAAPVKGEVKPPRDLWKQAYDSTISDLDTDGIVNLRIKAAAFKAGNGQWVWKEADKDGLRKWIARKTADATYEQAKADLNA
jgi:hypothetical protein